MQRRGFQVGGLLLLLLLLAQWPECTLLNVCMSID